jgi:hypothetical protein
MTTPPPYDFVDQVSTLLITTTTTVLGNNNDSPSLASNASWRAYFLVLGNNSNDSPSLASNTSWRGLSSFSG